MESSNQSFCLEGKQWELIPWLLIFNPAHTLFMGLSCTLAEGGNSRKEKQKKKILLIKLNARYKHKLSLRDLEKFFLLRERV